jgi:outer membrane protein
MRRIGSWLLGMILSGAGCGLISLASSFAAEAPPLTLHDAITRAITNAPTAAAATAVGEFDDARAREAGVPFYPTVGGVGEYNQAPGYSKALTNGGLTQAQLALDYTVWDGGRRSSQLRAARSVAEASRLGVDVARAQIVFDTTVAYYDLARARGAMAEQRRSLARLTQYLAIVEQLQQTGRALANDVLKIRATRDAGELSLAAALQAVIHAAIVLDAILGTSDSANVALAIPPELPSSPSGDITQSPVFAVAQRRLEAAAAGVAAARSERMPIVKLALTSGWQGINPQHTFDHNLGASYDGAISVPLFDGGLARAHIDEAQATQHLALAQLRATLVSLRRDLADAVAGYQGARRQLDLVARGQSTADDAFAITWTRFLGGGNVTLLEVTDAYQQAENLRLARLDDEFAARKAAAQASLILGAEP